MTEDLYAFRASAELEIKLREFIVADNDWHTKIAEWDEAHDGHELLWVNGISGGGDRKAVGFRDGTTEVPAGLSRAKTRHELIPVRGKAGNEWRDALAWANSGPKVAPIFKEFDVPSACWALDEGRVYGINVADTGEDGVILFCRRDPTGGKFRPHMFPIPLSEFYAIKERLETEKKGTAK